MSAFDQDYVDDIVRDALKVSPDKMFSDDEFKNMTAPDVRAGYRAEFDEAHRVLIEKFRQAGAVSND